MVVHAFRHIDTDVLLGTSRPWGRPNSVQSDWNKDGRCGGLHLIILSVKRDPLLTVH